MQIIANLKNVYSDWTKQAPLVFILTKSQSLLSFLLFYFK